MASRPPIPPITNQFPIVDGNGQPTDYFIRYLQERGLDVDSKVTPAQVAEMIADWSAGRFVNTNFPLMGGGPLSADLTLDHEPSGVAAGVYGDATHVPQFNVDVDGHITGVVEVPISGGGGGGGLSLISSTTIAVAAATIPFTAIPATYKDLVVVLSGRGTNATAEVVPRLNINGDTGANYDGQLLWWYSTGGNASQFVGATFAQLGGGLPAASAPAGAAGQIEIVLANYAGTTFNKTATVDWMSKNGTGTFSQGRGMTGISWRSSAAINALTLSLSAGNFAVGTVASLYGRG